MASEIEKLLVETSRKIIDSFIEAENKRRQDYQDGKAYILRPCGKKIGYFNIHGEEIKPTYDFKWE